MSSPPFYPSSSCPAPHSPPSCPGAETPFSALVAPSLSSPSSSLTPSSATAVQENQASKYVRAIDLDVDIGADAVDYNAIAKQESLSGLEVEMRKLEGVVKEIVDELNYLKRREARMRDTNGEFSAFSFEKLGAGWTWRCCDVPEVLLDVRRCSAGSQILEGQCGKLPPHWEGSRRVSPSGNLGFGFEPTLARLVVVPTRCRVMVMLSGSDEIRCRGKEKGAEAGRDAADRQARSRTRTPKPPPPFSELLR